MAAAAGINWKGQGVGHPASS